jgi:hypothetical protein
MDYRTLLRVGKFQKGYFGGDENYRDNYQEGGTHND